MITTGVLFDYGILTLPLGLMMAFGQVGFRPGQIFTKITGIIINLLFLFNFLFSPGFLVLILQ